MTFQTPSLAIITYLDMGDVSLSNTITEFKYKKTVQIRDKYGEL